MDTEFLYVGRDLTVAQFDAHEASPNRVVVTLDYWRSPEERHLPSPFCRSFFKGVGITQVHIFATWNHWYHTDELIEVGAIIRSQFPSAEMTLFGGSMGGYGAFRLHATVCAEMIVAFSPQAEVHAAYDTRFGVDWEDVSARDRFFEGTILPRKTFVIYDPYVPDDRRHVDTLRRYCNFFEIKFPLFGHSVDRALYQTGAFEGLMTELLEGVLTASRVSYWRRRNRRASSDYCRQLEAHRLARCGGDRSMGAVLTA